MNHFSVGTKANSNADVESDRWKFGDQGHGVPEYHTAKCHHTARLQSKIRYIEHQIIMSVLGRNSTI